MGRRFSRAASLSIDLHFPSAWNLRFILPLARNPDVSEDSMSYVRFAAMIATSTIIMFGLMYLNTYSMDHLFFSQTRAWMALLMGATMAVVMLLFMWRMYENTSANIAIVIAAVVAFGGSLALVRSQATVDDVSYMKAMIPHHSIAVTFH